MLHVAARQPVRCNLMKKKKNIFAFDYSVCPDKMADHEDLWFPAETSLTLAVWVVILSMYCTSCLAIQHPVRHAHSRHKRQHTYPHSQYDPSSFIVDGPGGREWGDWGPWSDPSECSRSCGGGVAFQSRICRDTQSDSCQGGSKRYFSCNLQDCRSGTEFRAEQCAEFNRVAFENKFYEENIPKEIYKKGNLVVVPLATGCAYYNGKTPDVSLECCSFIRAVLIAYSWIPYTKAPNRCELNCMPRAERFYYRHKRKVIDGTRCNEEKMDVCVDGQCLPVGCDGLLGSEAREDNCRECGGDGSSCTTVSDVLANTDLQGGYNDILLIPAGATNIQVKETQATNNYLAIRNTTGHYYLNGNWRIDFPRDLRFCGTIFHYERKPHGFYAPDSITALGPTTEALYIVLLRQEPNPGVSYEYSLPKGMSPRVDPDSYNWVYDDFGVCSSTCGGGVQTRAVTCERIRDSVQVANNLCDATLEPPSVQACAPEPCAPRWAIGQWGECNESCKKGVQERQVYCEQVVANGLPSVVNESLCSETGPKPQNKQECNVGVICPQWHLGPWKPCDKLCGDGKQRRDVQCYRKVDGKIQVLEDSACPEEKPEAEKPCFLRPCDGVDWITSEWSGCDDSCGLTQETRTVQCATSTGVVFPNSFCHKYRLPALVRNCESVKKCEHEWFAGQWSKCSSKCGAGVQTRKVFCGAYEEESVKKVEDSNCDADQKYESEKNCTGPELCTGDWFTGPWSPCTKPCGGGEMTRRVICLLHNETTAVTNCDGNSVPFASEGCNANSCVEDDVTPVDASHDIRDDEDEEDCEEEDDEVTGEEDGPTSPIAPQWMTDALSSPASGSTDDSSSLPSSTESSDATSAGTQGSSAASSSEGSTPDTTATVDSSSIGGSTVSEGSSPESSSSVTSSVSSSEAASSSESSLSTESGSSPASSISLSDSTKESSSDSSPETSLGSSAGLDSTTESLSSSTDSSISSSSQSSSGDSSSSAIDSTTSGSSVSSDSTTDILTSVTDSSVSSSSLLSESSSSQSTDSSSSQSTESTSSQSTESTSSQSTESTSSQSTESTSSQSTESTSSQSTDSSSSSSQSTSDSPESSIQSSGATSESSSKTASASTSESSISSSVAPQGKPSVSRETGELAPLDDDDDDDDDDKSTLGSDTTTVNDEIKSSTSSELSSESTYFSGVTDESTESSTDQSTESSPAGSTEITTEESTASSLGGSSPSGTSDSSSDTTDVSSESSTYSPSTDTFSSSTSESDISSVSVTTESGSSTSSGVTNLFDLWGSSSSTIQQAVSKEQKLKKCKRKKKPACLKSEFGCCPDNKTAAEGPFGKGCASPETCSETKFGCCSDGVSPAKGKDEKGCPPSACKETLFGCCPDGSSVAAGNDYEGCPEPDILPVVCATSQFGCCPDDITPAHGPNNWGCFECEGSGECEFCNQTKHGCCDDGIRAAEGPNQEGCIEGSGDFGDCNNSTFGCCRDGIISAEGPNFENCGVIDPSNCTSSYFGCCPDGVTSALGNSYEGCPMPCEGEPHGCCPDNATPAHGPNREGCCLNSPYGCCPDNILDARGPNFEGCGCQYSPHGCCPDNLSAARGPNKEGCGCQYTTHGCCPNQYTPAAGPDFQGCPCYTFQFGCCPNGVTRALGPQRLGCGCENTEFGCCPDGKTPSNGTEEGCGCEASRFGCCPDGETESKGEKFEGCNVVPFSPGEACQKDKDRGSCRDFSVKWFYDMEYGGCSRFWYGGCEGNDNRFKSKEECNSTCVEPPGKAKCTLPKVVGPCDGYYPKWYYDSERKQCGQFIYGGCLGNNNKFETREECQQECASEQISDVCEQPVEEGPCDGNFTRWGFNKETKSCEEFRYGGCKANGNNFPTQIACVEQCLQPGRRKVVLDECYLEKDGGDCRGSIPRWYYDPSRQDCRRFIYGGCGGNRNRFKNRASCLRRCQQPTVRNRDSCSLPREPGLCGERIPRWYFDHAENRCMPFYYTGCGGNDNQFDTQESCESNCPPIIQQDDCLQPALIGECHNYTEAWYYDSLGRRCKPFYYGGCGGNRNNFPTEQHCQQRCEAAGSRERPVEQEFRTEFCFYNEDPGPCQNSSPQWFYNRTDGVCKQFLYGGCAGNSNRFPSRSECEHRCSNAQDACSLPKVVGPCQGNYPRWFYNGQTDSCYEFDYGGCEGNANNFDARTDCESRCRRGPPPPPPVVATPPPPVQEPDTSEICSVKVDPGPCLGDIQSWYFDQRTLRCERFVYGGCGGNANRFDSEEQCERQCGRFKGQDVCTLPYDSGPCGGSFRKWHYDPSAHACREFLYGGCEGNSNRFSSAAECENLCLHREEVIPVANETALSHLAICRLPAEVGPCEGGYYKRWHYDRNQRTCVAFIYSGCGGNFNRFKNFDTCIKFCTVSIRDKKIAPLIDVTEKEERDPNEIEVDRCSEARRECGGLHCPYGIEKFVDRDNCERCRCNDPCRDQSCPDGSRCAVDLYRDENGSVQSRPVCREVNKPGLCPTLAVGSGTCSQECVSDADCQGEGKCCNTGCGTSCVQPAAPTVPPTPPPQSRPLYPGASAPTIQAEELNVTAEEGSYATLRCIVRGSPTPVITWRRSSVIIDGSGGRHRFLGDGSLQIIGLYRSDAGTYYCSADNGIGYPVQREFLLHVSDPQNRPAAVVTEEDTYVVVTLGGPTVLQCYAYGWPIPGVQWWRGDRALPSVSAKYEQRRDRSLLIKTVGLRDLGPYQCQVYNGWGKAATGSVVVQAIGPVYTSNPEDEKYNQYLVSAPERPQEGPAPRPRPPYRPRPPPETKTTTTGPPTEPPRPPVQPLPQPPPRQPEPEPEQPRVYIVPVRTNISLENPTFPQGSDISIPCDVEGYPYPQVRWYKENDLLQPSERINISESNRLQIVRATTEDSGAYRCEASNQYGSSSSSVIISVEGIYVHPNCTDNQFFANCGLIVRARHCNHKYYAKFCCRSCTLAGQLPSYGSHLETKG